MFQNIPHITKNILLINIMMFVATFVFQGQYNLIQLLGAHTFNSPLFEPYQMVTHFFMHGGLTHIFFNMFALVMFGSHLERVWGPKRFFIFYIVTAFGALALYSGIGTYEVYLLKEEIRRAYEQPELTLSLMDEAVQYTARTGFRPETMDPVMPYLMQDDLLTQYFRKSLIPMVGASGAIFGLLAAFGILFPNTQLMLLFPPIPIKAKYLVAGLMAIEIYLSFKSGEGSSVAHLAHVGGGLIGFILVKLWKKDRTNFY